MPKVLLEEHRPYHHGLATSSTRSVGEDVETRLVPWGCCIGQRGELHCLAGLEEKVGTDWDPFLGFALAGKHFAYRSTVE